MINKLYSILVSLSTDSSIESPYIRKTSPLGHTPDHQLVSLLTAGASDRVQCAFNVHCVIGQCRLSALWDTIEALDPMNTYGRPIEMSVPSVDSDLTGLVCYPEYGTSPVTTGIIQIQGTRATVSSKGASTAASLEYTNGLSQPLQCAGLGTLMIPESAENGFYTVTIQNRPVQPSWDLKAICGLLKDTSDDLDYEYTPDVLAAACAQLLQEGA